tara:strand:+ start:92 stop:529 length:438 start_codon:yes stop_codon:yes gene_type:complete
MIKIYKLIDNTNGNIYIGQTKQKLYKRLNNHKQDYKRGYKGSSKEIIKNGDYKIELIEETTDKLRERYWIENTKCINKVIPNRTRKEHYEETKHLLDKKKLSEYLKKYSKETNYHKIKSNWYSSMGGSPYKNNNSLLKIDINLFV